MIEYVNLFLLLTMFGSTCYAYYRVKKIFYLISIVMDSEILDQLTNLGRDVDSEFPKPKRGRKEKADPKINEVEYSDVRDKRERLVACVLSGNSKIYLGKEYTEQQINEMKPRSFAMLIYYTRQSIYPRSAPFAHLLCSIAKSWLSLDCFFGTHRHVKGETPVPVFALSILSLFRFGQSRRVGFRSMPGFHPPSICTIS